MQFMICQQKQSRQSADCKLTYNQRFVCFLNFYSGADVLPHAYTMIY